MTYDLSLYLVTNRGENSVEELCTIVDQAIKGGVSMVQLREKNITDDEYTTIAKKLLSITQKHNVPLIINDNVDVAKQSGADGVHLGQGDGSTNHARKILGENALIGRSINTAEQLHVAQQEPIDYIGFGPIFATSTKPDHAHPIGLEKLKTYTEKNNLPAVAIGGINEKNAAPILQQDVQGLAVVSAIYNATDPEKAARILRKIIDKESKNDLAKTG